ncbi:nuclear nucleic acid-binding protein C1D [Chironomus tepperi]|uniref:nuclear nucleic acid-binding protein C1D n=1 Tax=Chironomus tepperi TaxID=113505 RepID=UPI00391EF362
MDFGELKNDISFVSKIEASTKAIDNIRQVIDQALEMNTDEMSLEEKVKYDIFLAYAVNSLYFMYLKVDGQDVSSHEIRHELTRIKEVMQKNQQVLDKKLRPTVAVDAAKRLVKGGLYDFKKKNEEFKQRYQNKQPQQHHQSRPGKIDINYNPNTAVNRKRKFEDED